MANVIFSWCPAWSQTTFQRTYGTAAGNEYGYAVEERIDGTLLVVGPEVIQVGPFNHGGHGFLLKASASGDSTGWNDFTPVDADLELEHVIKAANGNFILSGGSEHAIINGNSDLDVYVAKCDSTGEVIWARNVGGAFRQMAFQSKPTPDAGIISAGENSVSTGPNDGAIYLVRCTGNGDTLWTRTHHSPTPWKQSAFCVSVLPDSGFAVGGFQNHSTPGALVMRTNPNGDTLWTRRLDVLGQGEVRDLLVNSEGNIVNTGYCTATGYSTPYLAELDTSGTVLWSQVYDQFTAGWARGICATADGYAIGGLTYQYDFFILKTDFAGNYLWHRTFDIAGDYGYSITSTADGGFALAGFTNGPGWPSAQVVLIKTDGSGNVVTSTHDMDLDTSVTATLFPNPVAGTSTFQYSTAGSGAYTLVLHDGVGRVVRVLFSNERRAPGQYEEAFDLTDLASGAYTLVLSNGQRAASVKAIRH